MFLPIGEQVRRERVRILLTNGCRYCFAVGRGCSSPYDWRSFLASRGGEERSRRRVVRTRLRRLVKFLLLFCSPAQVLPRLRERQDRYIYVSGDRKIERKTYLDRSRTLYSCRRVSWVDWSHRYTEREYGE